MSNDAQNPLVLLVNPDWRKLGTPGRFRLEVPYFPLELMYIEGALARHGIGSVMADMWAGTIEEREFQELLPRADYIVLTTAPTYIFWRDGVCGVEFPGAQLAELRARAPKARIIVIGPQGTILPKTLEGLDWDYLVRGEAELAVGDLIAMLERGEEPSASMQGVCAKADGNVRISPSYAYVPSMDDLPELSFASIRRGRYGQVSFEASRGCPYACTFCCREGFRGKLRAKSRERLRAELTALSDAGYNHIAMIDEIFGMNAKWLKEFCEVAEPLGLRWGIQTRTECLSREKLQMMARAGCMSLEIGLESADPEVSEAIGKRTDYEDLARNVRAACEAGFEQVRLFCIFGSPRETVESMRKTKEFLLQFADLPAVQADVFPMLPLPGTGVWNLGVQKGYALHDWSDVEKFAGIIENAFHDPREVEAHCAAFAREWEYMRLREGLSHTASGRLTLARMWLTVKVPALRGLRKRMAAMFRGQQLPRYRIPS